MGVMLSWAQYTIIIIDTLEFHRTHTLHTHPPTHTHTHTPLPSLSQLAVTSQTLLPVVVLTADQNYTCYAAACEKNSQWIKNQLAHSHTTSHNMWDMNCLSTSQLHWLRKNSSLLLHFPCMYSSCTYLTHNIHTYRTWLWCWVIHCDDTEHYHVQCTTINCFTEVIASQHCWVWLAQGTSTPTNQYKHTLTPWEGSCCINRNGAQS